MSFKSTYAGLAHALGGAAEASGFTGWLERRPHSRTARWARSLFAIYDIDAMTRLDLPWWSFDAIDKVAAHLAARPGARVFEYGSGASTIWLGKRAGEVISVEHDAGWYPVVANHVAAMPNVRLRLVPPDPHRNPDPAYGSEKPGWTDKSFRDYVHAIDAESGSFDVIVVDGRARPACLAQARSRLSPGGVIVFDNSRRPHYQAAIRRSGMKVETCEGLTACLPYPDPTTLLTA